MFSLPLTPLRKNGGMVGDVFSTGWPLVAALTSLVLRQAVWGGNSDPKQRHLIGKTYVTCAFTYRITKLGSSKRTTHYVFVMGHLVQIRAISKRSTFPSGETSLDVMEMAAATAQGTVCAWPRIKLLNASLVTFPCVLRAQRRRELFPGYYRQIDN